jgi:Ca-activated chloride channel family protein
MKKTILLLLMLAGLTGLGMSQSRTITGTVRVDDDKSLLPGVSIIIKGTKMSTQTDTKGHYSIVIPDDKTVLHFAYVGYTVVDTLVGKQDKIDVWLKVSGKSLNEVVVIGYGTETKRDVTGSVATINGAPQALKQISINQANVLRGSVAGVDKSAQGRTNSNQPVAALLNTRPGLEVGLDGSITHQGQTVTRVRVNGKDYAGGNVAQAIQNLPADIANQIQVVDDYGDQANITGIKSGNPTKAIYYKGKRIDVVQNESYNRIIENQFLDPKNAPLSTFAVDVDAAGYSNFRRFINNGQLPPKSAVRIEEMINYFHYNLPAPENGDPVFITTELSAAPWNAEHRLLRIGLKARDVKMDKLPPSNLVFLLDVSGSMQSANKLPLVKASMKLLVDKLRPVDHVTIVTYAGDAGLKLASTPGDKKMKIDSVIDQLYAGGSTAGGAGLIMAYDVAKNNFIKGGNNRIILATDGDFNVGASNDKDMEQLITDERDSKVSISILGFGMGNLKDSKMETMADKGHGNYAYIDNITEATKSMVSEFGGTLFTVAKDVKLQIEFNPAKVQAYRLLGYEDRLLNKEDFNNDQKLGGDMGVGHTVTALYEIIPPGVKDNFTNSVDPLKYQKPNPDVMLNNSPEMVTIKFRYKQPDGDKSKMEQVTVTDKPEALNKTSDDFRFASSIAELGLLLRDSEFKQNANFGSLITRAKGAKGKDEDGYRSEFIRLAESVKLMSKGAVN